MSMRVGFGQFSEATPEYLQFAAQYGATDVLVNLMHATGLRDRLELPYLVKLRCAVEEWGLTLGAVENVPIGFYDQIMLGGPRREEQVENMVQTVRNIARAGIPAFGYHWMPSAVWRTRNTVLRGGAVATGFDGRLAADAALTHGREHSEEEMWARLEEWIRIITPVAEEEGIRLGIHPCDPPVPVLGGVPQILRSFAAFRRLIEIHPSDANGVEFCQGTFAQMDGEDVYEMIRYFGIRKKIIYVHFRNVSGTVPAFHEEFVNTGYVDMYRAMRIYHEVGYDGFFIDDHVPLTAGDTAWGHRGRAFAAGYIQGLIDAVTQQGGADADAAPGRA